MLDLAAEVGIREAAQLLLAARTLGPELVLRRLFGLEGSKPLIEVDTDPAGGRSHGALRSSGSGRASRA